MANQPVTIRALTPALRDDFLRFMEGAAFADNPKWQSCYCQFLYVDHTRINWHQRTAIENRTDACARIACGHMHGLLAYRDGEVVGWCNAAPRTLLGAFSDEPDPDAARLGQITCFVVALPHRRSGVATALLSAACDLLRDLGMEIAEASPLAEATTDAKNHYGPLSLYLAGGFKEHRKDPDGTVYVRRPLI